MSPNIFYSDISHPTPTAVSVDDPLYRAIKTINIIIQTRQ